MAHAPPSGYTIQQCQNVYWLRYYGRCTKELTRDLHLYMNETVMKRRSPYYWINDLGDAEAPSGTRALWSEYLDANRDYVAQFNRGSPYVVSSAIARGMLTAFHWVFAPPYPVMAAASLDEAVAWILDRMPDDQSGPSASSFAGGLRAAEVEFDNRTDGTAALHHGPIVRGSSSPRDDEMHSGR